MGRRSAIHLIRIAGVASSLSALLLLADDFTIHNDVRLVLLDVGVQSHGIFVPGLKRENFSVFEDGKPQTISAFDNQDAPVTMGILVDESASMTPERAQVLTAAGSLINESNRADQVFVLNFNDYVTPGLPEGVPFSDSVPDLRAALYRGRPQGKTALYDAMIEGLKDLDQGRRGRKTLVLITDGGDTTSRHKRTDAMAKLESSTATVFAIGLYQEGDLEIDPGFLKHVARMSGGESFFPMNGTTIQAACERIAHEIRSRYTIGYVPRGGADLPTLRHIQVRVKVPGRSGLTVLTRTSYRYDSQTSK
jgi:VWFA-related protein